jgi:hypothetical protein
MARQAGINQIAVNLAEVVHRYAAARRWPKDDYHIFMKYRSDYFILNIIVAARALEGRADRQRTKDYDDLYDRIRAEARPELEALNDLGLVLTGLSRLDLYWPPILKPAEIEIDEKRINHGVSWSDPTLPAAH